MKYIFWILLGSLLMFSGCGEGPSDDTHTSQPVNQAKPNPGQEKISGVLSFEKNQTEPIEFIQQKEQKEHFESAQPSIIPASIPDELSITFPSKKEWLGGNLTASILFGKEVRDLHSQINAAENGKEGVQIKVLDLKNVLPQGLGLMTSINLEISYGNSKQYLLIRFGTPPNPQTPEVSILQSAEMRPILVSPVLSIMPLVRIRLMNTSLSNWTLTIPYLSDSKILQRVKSQAFSQAECSVKVEENEREETLYPSLLLIRSGVNATTIAGLPLSDLAQADSFQLKPQETVQFTLYAMIDPNQPSPVLQGRRTTDKFQLLSPGCKDGRCHYLEAAWNRITLIRKCEDGEVVLSYGWGCRYPVTGVCPRAGGLCNFGPDRAGWLVVGRCLEYYVEPLPSVSFANYTDVVKTWLNTKNLFKKTSVKYSDSVFSTQGQQSSIPWQKETLQLN